MPIFTKLAVDALPTRPTVLQLQREAKEFLKSHKTKCGSKYQQFGHIGLVLSATEYTTETKETTYEPPTYPGDEVDVTKIDDNEPTKYQVLVNLAIQKHHQQKENYFLYETQKTQVKEGLIEASEKWITALKDETEGYSQVEPYTILKHLFDNFGQMDDDTVRANYAKLTAPWIPSEINMDELFQRQKACQKFAKTSDEPIHDKAIMRETLTIIETATILPDAIKDWKKELKTGTKKLPEFEKHFKDAYIVYMKLNKFAPATSQEAGYHGAHAATNATTAATTTSTTFQGHWNYCWTHGLTLHRPGSRLPPHTSANCNRKAEGHKNEATLENLMGGNNRISYPRGMRNDFLEANPSGSQGNPRPNRARRTRTTPGTEPNVGTDGTPQEGE